MRLPTVIKTSVGTASRGVRFVRNADELEKAQTEFAAGDAFAGEVLIQELLRARPRRRSRCSAMADRLDFTAIDQSPWVSAARRSGTASLGLWEAMFSRRSERDVDKGRRCHALLIDRNPRLVEPMNTHLSGADLVGLFASQSLRERGAPRGGARGPPACPDPSRDAGAARLRGQRRRAVRYFSSVGTYQPLASPMPAF